MESGLTNYLDGSCRRFVGIVRSLGLPAPFPHLFVNGKLY